MSGQIRLRPEGEPLPAPLFGLPDDQWERGYALARRREREGALVEFPGYRTCAEASEGETPPRIRFVRWLYDEGLIGPG